MNSYCTCWYISGVKKLVEKKMLRNVSNYRSLASCSLLNAFDKTKLAQAPVNAGHIFNKSTRPVGSRYFSASSRRCDASDPKLSIAVSLLNETKDVQNENAKANPLAEEVERGFLELQELADTEIRKALAIFVGNEDEACISSVGERTTFVKIPRSGSQVFELYGTPDPKQPASNVPCHGCGANLHCKDPGIPGYMPSQSFLAVPKSHLKNCICQRCQMLKEKKVALDLSIPLSKFNPIVQEVKKHSALIILLVDMADISNAFHKTFRQIQNVDRPMYIIGNKIDLIPKDGDGYLERAMEALVEAANENGFSMETNVKHFALVSAKSGYGIEDLISKMLSEWRLKGHVFIMGCANSGKSTLFNVLLASDYCRSAAKEVIQRATTSIWPGTTLNLLKFPILNPKPPNLYEREQRLMMERSEEREENKLKASLERRRPNLQSKIDTTFLTPGQMAMVSQAPENVGYLVPSYTMDEGSDGQLIESVGSQGAMEYLDVKPLPYNDSTFKYWCYDTPGLINPDQVINLLNQSELLVCVPKKTVSYRTYFLRPGQVMFVSGLSRIDHIEGDEVAYLTVFTSLDVPVNIVEGDEADEFYEKHLGTETFGIPIGDSSRIASIPPLVGTDFNITGCGFTEGVADIVLSSLGWVNVTVRRDEVIKIRAYTPGGAGCRLRKQPLVKYAINFKGSRIIGTNMYRTRAVENTTKNKRQSRHRNSFEHA